MIIKTVNPITTTATIRNPRRPIKYTLRHYLDGGSDQRKVTRLGPFTEVQDMDSDNWWIRDD